VATTREDQASGADGTIPRAGRRGGPLPIRTEDAIDGSLNEIGCEEGKRLTPIHNGLGGGSSPAEPTTHSFEPRDFPETAEEPAIGGHLRLRFGLRGDRFWPEGYFGRFVSGSRNPVSPMQ
jgi:hypothetical protein